MAVRGWGGPVTAAIGLAAGAGAAQLGLGYGLGIISWLPAADGAGEAAWVASLAWAVWIAAASTIAGAICAGRLGGPAAGASTGDGEPVGSAAPLTAGPRRMALTVAAAVGALVTVALVAVPARAATRADTFSPQTIAAGYAVVGVILGLLVAMWALSSRAVASNVITTVGWLWLLAVVAVVDGVVSGRGLVTQLGVWQITADGGRFWFRDYVYWPAAALSLGSAFLIGAVAARRPARRLETRVGAAVSGGVGPLVVAAVYVVSAPRLVGIRAEQLSAHLMAPYAVIAGLAGSVMMTALAQRAETRARFGPAPDEVTQPADRAEPVVVPAQAAATEPPENGGRDGDSCAPARANPTERVAATEGAGARRTDAMTTRPTEPAGDDKRRRSGRRSR